MAQDNRLNNQAHAPTAVEHAGDTVVLVKQGQRYVFHCATGEEHTLIEHVRELAQNPEHTLGWFDAAVLCHQLGQRMRTRLTTCETI